MSLPGPGTGEAWRDETDSGLDRMFPEKGQPETLPGPTMKKIRTKEDDFEELFKEDIPNPTLTYPTMAYPTLTEPNPSMSYLSYSTLS